MSLTKNESLAVGGTEIGEVDFSQVSQDDIAAWLHYDAIMEAESPLTPFQLARTSLGSLTDNVAVRLFVARDPDGAVAAEGRVVTTPTTAKTGVCPIHVSVRPDRRGRGIAGTLLKLVVEAAETEGYTAIVGWTSEKVSAGAKFARRFRGEKLLDLVLNTLLLSELSRNKVDQWITQGSLRNAEYTLTPIHGAYPSEMMAALVELRMIANSGHPRFLHEMPIFTVEAVRAEEATLIDGQERSTLVAIHRPTGTVAGFTYVYYHRADSRRVRQAGTAVRTEHRGRCLGKWLKAGMLEQVMTSWPDVEEILTCNVVTNKAIIGINQALGFKATTTSTAWQASVPSRDTGSNR